MRLKSWQSLEAKILTHLLNFETTFLYRLLKLGVSAILGQGSTDEADETMDLVDAVGADDSQCS